MKKQRQELSIHDFIGIFLPKLWIIVSVAVLFGIATMVYSLVFKSDTYTSETEMYVYKHEQTATGSDIDVAQKVLPNYKHTLLGNEFLKKISRQLLIGATPYDVKPSELRSMISFSSPTDTKFFIISVTSASPDLSYRVATLIQETAPSFIMDKQKDALYISLAESAQYNGVPNSKGTVSNALISAAIGALISAFVVWLVWMFDFIVHDKKKLESRFDIPVLGVIPRQMLQDRNVNTMGGYGRNV